MNKLIKIAGTAVVAIALAQTIQAVPVTGNIGFTGGVTYDTSSAGTATQVTSWINPVVTLTTVGGSFASIPLSTPAVFTSSIWNFATSTSISPFWSVGGFTFTLISSSIVSQGATTPGTDGSVFVSGSGIVTGNGYDATTMLWTFNSQDPKAGSNPDSWTFAARVQPPSTVPDGGATAMLLGAALSGLALLKRKLAA